MYLSMAVFPALYPHESEGLRRTQLLARSRALVLPVVLADHPKSRHNRSRSVPPLMRGFHSGMNRQGNRLIETCIHQLVSFIPYQPGERSPGRVWLAGLNPRDTIGAGFHRASIVPG